MSNISSLTPSCEYLSFQADIAGSVLSTVRLRDLVTMPPVNIMSIDDPFLSTTPLAPQPKALSSMNFSRLLLMFNKFLIAWQNGSLFIFHPSSYSLLCWTNSLDNIVQVECVNEKVKNMIINFELSPSLPSSCLLYHPIILLSLLSFPLFTLIAILTSPDSPCLSLFLNAVIFSVILFIIDICSL